MLFSVCIQRLACDGPMRRRRDRGQGPLLKHSLQFARTCLVEPFPDPRLPLLFYASADIADHPEAGRPLEWDPTY